MDQDNFILKHTKASPVSRRRPKTGARSGKGFNVVYYARRRNNIVPICRKTFLHILGLKKGRVNGVISRNFMSMGASAQENRGGDRKKVKFSAQRRSVKDFIKKFKPLEIHYCRGSIKCRQYLSSDLSIAKMYRLYKDQAAPESMNVKASYFRRIFNTHFNIGFGSPRTDVCSTCLQLEEQIKHEKNENKKNELMINKRVHKLRARAFYDLLKENYEYLLILSFDCQKNQPMPKIPDQITYYSRQLYIYNFTVVVGHSKTELKKENVYSYTWTEDILPKASNEIASAVFHCLCQSVEKYEQATKIRLVCDGCSGQNKNSIVLGMVSKYLLDYAPARIKSIEIVFPVVGHSFLPPDRVFAQIEKKIKKNEEINNPEAYERIFKEHATVLHLGTEVEAYQWKEECAKVLKTTSAMHFSIKECKRFILKRNKTKTNVLVRGEVSYRNQQSDFKLICKKGKSVSQINPDPAPLFIKVKDKKLSDVKTLLTTHYGENWEELSDLNYFKEVLSRPDSLQHEYEHENCEPMQEVPHLIV